MLMKLRYFFISFFWLVLFGAQSQPCPPINVDFNYTYIGCSEISFQDNSNTPNPNFTLVDWEWDFGDGSPNAFGPNVTHSYVPGDLVNVTLLVTVDSMGFLCQESFSQFIAVNQKPDVFISSTPNPGCEGDVIFFTGTSGFNITLWEWDFGDGSVSSLNSPNQTHTYGSPGTYDVILTVTDVNGCDSTYDPPYQQVIGENPIADFSWDPDPACLNAPVQFTDLSTPIPNVVSWNWNFGDGSTSNRQNPLHSFATTGNFNVTLTVTTTENCSSSITQLVDVNPLPIPDFITNTPVCFGDSVQFTNLSTSPNGNIEQWIWDFGDGNTITINRPSNPNISHLYGGTGIFEVFLTVTDSDSCQNTTSRLIEVASNPIADFIFDESCFGDPVMFTDLSSPNGGPALYTWDWNFGDPLSGVNNISTLQNPSHIFTNPGTYTVSLIVNNTIGCSDTSIQDIIVDTIPQVDFTMADDTICLGENAVFTGIGSTFNSWFWNFGDGNTSTQQNPVHTYQLPGVYTVTLTATTTEGCVSTISYNIRVNQLPAANFTASAPTCQNDSIAFTDQSSSPNGLIIQWIWDFSDGTVVTIDYPSNPNISHLFGSSGSYEVFLTVMDIDSCQNTTSRIIQVITSPVANFTFENACLGSPVLFTDLSSPNGGPDLFTWDWNFDDPPSGVNNSSTLQNPSHIFTNPGTYSVSLMVTNTQGCFDTITMDVVVDSLPSVDFTMANDTVCLGDNAVFSGIGTNISIWQWDFGDGIGVSGQPNPVYMYTQPGTYTVTLTVTDINGCQNSISYNIRIRDLPNVDFTFNNACSGDSTYFIDATVITNGFPVAWDWNFGDGGTSALQSPSHYYNTFGNFQVSLTVTDNFGCINSYTQLISVYDGPTAAFSFETPCEPAGQAFFFDESTLSNSNSPIQSWLWDFGDGFFSTEMNPVHIYSVTDSCYTVTLLITDANGCSSTDTSFNVCVLDPLNISFTATEACFGQPTQFRAFYSPPNDSILLYTWRFNDGSLPVATYRDTINHIFSAPGNYTVQLTALDTNGCSMTIYENVYVNQLPSPNFTYTMGTCEEPTQFFDQSLGGGAQLISWYWDFGDPGSGAANNSDDQHPIHYYPPQDSSYQVKLIVTNLNGCVDSIVKTVERNPCLIADFYAPSGTLCANTEVCFTDNSTIASNNTSISNWFWDFGDGTNYSYNIQENPVCHTYTSGGTYDVTLIITAVTNNSITLRDSTVRTITINPTPDANFYITSSTCFGTLTQFTDISDENGGSITNWEWDFGDPANPASTSDEQNPAYMYFDHGTYTVELIVSNDYGCSDTLEQDVEIFEKPEAEFSFDVSCLEKQTFFFDESIDGGGIISSWYWNFGNPLSIIDTSTHQDPYYVYNETGTYNVNLIVTDDNMCKDTVIHEVEVYENPIADFEIYDSYEGEQGVIYFANTSEDAVSYFWDFGDGQVSDEENPIITYGEDGLYTITLIAYSEENCADTISYNYEMLYKTLYVPNAFIPGNLGWNYEDGRFIVKGVNLYRYHLYIYDAWGDLIWETDALIDGRPAASWNGRNENNPNLDLCPAGAYTWKIDAVFKDGTKWKGSDNGDGNTNTYGTVLLIR